MKKLLFIFCFLGLWGLSVRGQTSTIQDYGKYVGFNYASGDTVFVGKDNITHIISRRDVVILFTNHAPDESTKVSNQWLVINPDDFGYTMNYLRRYLAAMFYKAYTETYSYDNGNLDTVSYYYGASLQYQVVYGYTDALVTSKTIITP